MVCSWGWRPRFGLEAYFQEVIKDADVAERFAGSHGRQVEDVTDKICDRVDADILGGLAMRLDDRTSWPAATGRGPKPMDIWEMTQDKGWFAACNDGTRYLDIEIDRESSMCSAKVRLWHIGCHL